MRMVLGLAGAAAFFAVSFALHIVGGSTGQGWLFAIAVALIYVSASGFGVFAWMLAGSRSGDRLTLGIGALAGVVLTTSALWAANGRSFAWWEPPLAAVITLASSAVLLRAWQMVRGRGANTGPHGTIGVAG